MTTPLTSQIADLSTGQLALFHKVAEIVLDNPAGISAGDVARILFLADVRLGKPGDEEHPLHMWRHLVGHADLGRRLGDEIVKIEKAVHARLDGPERGRAVLIETNRKGFARLSAFGMDVNEAAKRLLAGLHRFERRAVELRIAASEAASSYIFPDIMLEILGGRTTIRVGIRTGYFRPAMVGPGGELDRGETDLAIAWDTYTHPDRCSKAVVSGKVAHSETEPCVIYHPLHPFGNWMRTAAKRGSIADEAMLAELTRHAIVYPGALKSLADIFENHAGMSPRQVRENLIPVESFPAVANHVAMRVGVGLFPGWPKLLDKLRREMYLQHVALPRTLPKGVPVMSLVWLQPKDGQQPAAKEFIGLLEDRLRQLNSADHEDGGWVRAAAATSSATPFADLLRRSPPQRWDAYFINTGRGDQLYPHWRRGRWELKWPTRLSAGRGRCDGEYEMTISGKPLRFELEGEVGPDYLRVMSTQIGDDLKPDKQHPQFLCFQELYTRAGGAETMLLGFMTHAHPGRPTVAPFVLCSEGTELGVEDFHRIERIIECHPQAVLDGLFGEAKAGSGAKPAPMRSG